MVAVDEAWIGTVPANWVLLPGRRLFRNRRQKSQPNDEQLAATQKYGVIPQEQFIELEDQMVVQALAGLDGFRHVEADDFVISLRSFQGGIERSRVAGCVSPAYTVLEPNLRALPHFYEYLLKSPGYISALQAVTQGIREGKTIHYEEFGEVIIPNPPLPEQRAIANFLDRETAKIDALVEEQRKLIELLKEKRQALITQAVTKGLDPNVKMKDSGIEWLGEVPEHWRLCRLTHISRISGGGTPSRDNPDYWGGTIAWVSAKDVKVPFISDAEEHITIRGLNESTAKLVVPGTIIMVVRSGILRHTLPIAIVTNSVAINQDIKAVLFNDDAIIADYFRLFVNGYNDQLLHLWQTQGATVESIDMELMRKTLLPMPPVEEQQAIAELLTHKLEHFASLIRGAETSTILLAERRAALISAAVTGKIDVRDMIKEEETA